MTKKPTLKDVAIRAGVSTATVARVLHKKGYVAADTREQIERAIEEAGYRMNVLAQSLRQQRTRVLGNLLFSMHPNPFYAQVALGTERHAQQHGYSILGFSVQGDPDRERIGVETLIRRQVDAILFITPVSASNVQLAVDAGVPVVQVERNTRVQTSMVLVDNYAGSVAATEHLIALGHRRIAFIGSTIKHDSDGASQLIEEQRLAGYVDTMRSHGLPVRDQWVGLGEYFPGDRSDAQSDGYRFACQYLDEEPRPTAIFAAGDFLAAGVCQAIYARGLHVPNEISIVGYDDTLGVYLAPPLTTVVQPMLELGMTASELAIAELEANAKGGGPVLLSTLQLTTHLVVRASTGPPAEPKA